MEEGVCEAGERMWGHFGHIQSDVTESHPLGDSVPLGKS